MRFVFMFDDELRTGLEYVSSTSIIAWQHTQFSCT